MSAPNSDDVNTLIYDGVTTTTLAEIFGLDHKDVKKRLTGRVTPAPSKDKYTRYRIRDAAPYLCESKIDPEEMIKNLTPSKLPPALQDAFWKAQLSRQRYLQQRGELWSTERVLEVVSTAFKVIRMTILMFNDTLEDRTDITDEQRVAIQELGDGLLQSLDARINEEFAFYVPPPDEHGPALTDDAAQVVGNQTNAEQHAPEDEAEEPDPFA